MRVRRGRRLASIMVALLGLLAFPIGVSADTCACDPIQPFLVVDRLDEVHVTYRNADRPGVVYASNKSGSWVKVRITSGKDEPFAIAVDAAQKVSIVFQREYADDVRFFVISNRTGSWVTTRLAIDPGRCLPREGPGRRRPDPSRVDDRRARLVRHEQGRDLGAAPARQHDGQRHPARARPGGKVHLLYNQCTNDGEGTCEGAGIYHETDASGSWVAERVTTDQEDKANDLTVDAAGKVHLVFVREYNSQAQPDLPLGVYYVTNASGSWLTQRAAAPGRMANIERRSTGVIHITFARVDGNLGIFFATGRNGAWTVTEVIKEYALYPSTGISSGGRVHLAFMRMAIDPGIYHSAYSTTAWSRRELMD